MFKKILFPILLAFLSTQSFAYQWSEAFVTENFAVNEVILDVNEKLDDKIKQMLIKEISRQNKKQTTTAVFAHGKKGLKGTINEPLLALIQSQSYSKDLHINFKTNNQYATDVGIYLDDKTLRLFIDNKNLHNLVLELQKLPLVLSDLNIAQSSLDFENNLWYTVSNNAYLLDIRPIDSLFLDKSDLLKANSNCKVSIMGMVDRFIPGIPFFMVLHGAVNSLNCDNQSK